MEEVLLVDKPKGWTSFDVVGKIRSELRKKTGQKIKVGHAGTLDPLATGLLIILVGKATKQQDSFMKQDKTYDVVMRLGETSITADAEGEKTYVSDYRPTEAEVKAAINMFIGQISQIPPAYSAIKIDGQRAYKLARAGKEVKIEPRTVTIYAIEQMKYEYPTINFTATVSSGTYIRSLVTDIGDVLKTGAYMTDLRRTSIGKYHIQNALSPEQAITEVAISDNR
jgi:tRNA pseudouridine55 synthase